VLPLAWFAHRRSGWGIAGTLVALDTSVFRFPAPARPDLQILAFPEFEREWLTGDWNGQEVLLALLAPSSLTAFCLAPWKRFVVWGLVVLNLMAGGTVLWGVVSGNGTGWAMTAPALVGLGIGDVAVLWALRRLQARRHVDGDQPAARPVLPSASSS
jgi:hypothetical protein